jgi:hypothetical protein
VWLAATLDVSFRLWTAAWSTVGIAAGLAVWALSGGTVVAMAVWAVPAIVIAVIVIAWPTLVGLFMLATVVMLPLATMFAPVERLFSRVVESVSGWIVSASLSEVDRTTQRLLADASRGPSDLQADLRRLDEPERVVAAMRILENGIRSVPAPDPEWRAVIDQRAHALSQYREMLEGARPYNGDEASGAIAATRGDVHDLLRRRSRMYRLLTHQFTNGSGSGSVT